MSFTKAQVAQITKLAVDMNNDARLASTFAEYMLKNFPRESLSFAPTEAVALQPYEIEPGITVTPRVQAWMHKNKERFGNFVSGRSDMMVEAIKALRAQFGLSLREAKFTVEAYPFTTS